MRRSITEVLSMGKEMFSQTCVILFTGGRVHQGWAPLSSPSSGCTPPPTSGCTPPPSMHLHQWTHHHPWMYLLLEDRRSQGGRNSSYWNAYLLAWLLTQVYPSILNSFVSISIYLSISQTFYLRWRHFIWVLRTTFFTINDIHFQILIASVSVSFHNHPDAPSNEISGFFWESHKLEVNISVRMNEF